MYTFYTKPRYNFPISYAINFPNTIVRLKREVDLQNTCNRLKREESCTNAQPRLISAPNGFVTPMCDRNGSDIRQ